MTYSFSTSLSLSFYLDFLPQLVPLLEEHLISDPKWSHYDFTFGRNVGSVVNERILDILRRADNISDADLVLENEYSADD